jgi:ADP-ribose pyrophosphatase YjhB (NUDIX family)/glycerol-3-phosphate cytidylyltransferase-like family protein
MPQYPQKVILMNGGAFSPLHWGHVEALDEAAELCKQLGIEVVGKIISPNNSSYLRDKHGDKAMPTPERLRYIQHAQKFRPDVQLDTYAIDNDKGQHISRSQVIKQLRQKYPGVEPVMVGGDDVMGQSGMYRDSSGNWNISTSRKGTGDAGQSSSAIRARKQNGQPPLPFEIDPDTANHMPPPTIQKYMPTNPTTAKIKINRDMWLKIGQTAGWLPKKAQYQIQKAYGGVVFDKEGKVLIVEPLDHFDNTVWTFPKGKADPGESPEACAMREIREETGVPATVVGKIPGSYKGSTSITEYFLMRANDGQEHTEHDAETASVKWVFPQEAAKYLSMTGKASAKQRDLAVLSAAAGMIPKPQAAVQPQKAPAGTNEPQPDLLPTPSVIQPSKSPF